MNPDKITYIDFLRHGEPEGGLKYRGITDDPLTERGREQMWRAVGDRFPWNRIVTSPLRRCVEFAELLGQRASIPLDRNPAVQGWNFGAWEDKTRAQILQTDAEALDRFRRDPSRETPPGGESMTAIAARVTDAVTDVLAECAGERVLVITHAVAMRAVIAKILSVPLANVFSVEIGPGALTRLMFTHTPTGVRASLLFHAAFPPEAAS